MSIGWAEIVETFLKYPWWVWPTFFSFAWLSLKWLYKAVTRHIERPVITSKSFRQNRVHVDFVKGTITLPRGNTYPVSRIRGLRWEDYSKSGFFHAYVEVEDLRNPVHPVVFSTTNGPEMFIRRLRTVIEQAGGIRFSAAISDRFDIIERDFSNPITAATATRVTGQGLRVSFSRAD